MRAAKRGPTNHESSKKGANRPLEQQMGGPLTMRAANGGPTNHESSKKGANRPLEQQMGAH
jgi:hypothetical protein